MSALATHSAQRGLHTLALGSRRTAASCVASTRALRAYSSSKKDPSEPSFQGQMLESISSRIARERAEREKFARQRLESAGTRRWATTFGTKTPIISEKSDI
ncbi:hypothetical protein RRF57_006373 [Xylaria bambusicola]|uniref:Uncharacterized protein n=1 Tax=Xylaria bambusicola TaxID=326684 RepID=A0AAN7UJ68_9PEZI